MIPLLTTPYPNEHLLVAYHEAGHAIAAVVHRIPVRSAAIWTDPHGIARGRVTACWSWRAGFVFASGQRRDRLLRMHLEMTLASRPAVYLFTRDPFWSKQGMDADNREADRILQACCRGNERAIREQRKEIERAAAALINAHENAVHRIAHTLVARRRLSGKTIIALARANER